MAHSKRNTSLPHFTAYERGLLRNAWGTQRTRIGRDSFLPFASCRLCLQPAKTPVVACATSGDIFCRECAIADLLAQRQEIKRLETQRENARKQIEEEDARALEEKKQKELHHFEMTSMGLEGNKYGNNGSKRKAEPEEETVNADEDGKRRRVSEKSLPSFWVPSLTPGTDPNEVTAQKTIKLAPVCPGSTEANAHTYSLKSLVEVHFTEEKGEAGSTARVCPSCKKTLSNALRAMLTKPCGHVICSPCVTKFMTPHETPDPHASKEEQERTAALHGRMLCYVCETDVTESEKMMKKKKKKEGVMPGLVEISSEGTGFAGRGGNVASKAGVAFQC
ncbi:hypothetical protein ASPZODRAFT_11414 [Penicilliopsis zonata CBS 506.65]|uniref:RING-type domain-containing protein n=1 Tax=Penicilliopsis zonata CBS 506.65 TaxID=1073090 RepID=A0A1L9STM0_9EURO|nr:hypothetical protein ASPZODRAFT_11414 [Penicilliopsis zonata CBS 506.65]OJJ50548.1 hypothetical protein ASPZODRAFT_11414 [Penicilliopsis zonata CBS 506.65]